jgi:hypothetical protein
MVTAPAGNTDSWKKIGISGRFLMTVPKNWVAMTYDLPGAGQEMTIIKDPVINDPEVQVIAVLNEEGKICNELLLHEVTRSFMEGAGYTPLQGVPQNFNPDLHSLICACTDKEGQMIMMITREAGPYIVFIIGKYSTSEVISTGVNEIGVMAGSLVYNA